MAPALSSNLYTTLNFSVKPLKSQTEKPISLQSTIFFPKPTYKFNEKTRILSAISFSTSPKSARTCAAAPSTVTAPSFSTETSGHRHWIVVVRPPEHVGSKSEVIDYYVKILERVLGSEKDAQVCIYDASCDTHFGFCCDVDEETSRELASLPEVLSVRPDPDYNSNQKDYSDFKVESSSYNESFAPLFPAGSSKHWLVHVEMPPPAVITRAQLVDYYAQMLTTVLGNENDAQMCIYHISLQSNYGFCCELDDECAKELVGVPGVLSVKPDENVESDYKDYGGTRASSTNQPTNIKTKKLFVTGLSFYTSEKTLRAAFEGFGELVEVKIIMDKISKRSRGYAFIEYTTEEAASAALREMNGKIINGWMITVDVARNNQPKYTKGRQRPAA